jgi:sensor histidine kinase YesM
MHGCCYTRDCFGLQLLRLQDDMQRKESKWSAALAKLQEQVKYLERENQHLHEENHKLKLKQISSKVNNVFLKSLIRCVL